jgi:hypothetical protein
MQEASPEDLLTVYAIGIITAAANKTTRARRE